MYDKTTRRRRATVLGLVVLSLLMLTVYFGESQRGGLHALQRAALSVLGPIQEGANRALEPVGDGLTWAADLFDAKDARDRLQAANEELRGDIAGLAAVADDHAGYQRALGFDDDFAVADYGPVEARVIGSAPNLFYAKLVVDKGSSSGVRTGQAVVSDGGLVGRITTVSTGYSQVTLLTDESFGTGVQVLPAGRKATAEASTNDPGKLELALVNARTLRRGDRVVTDSSTELQRDSYYPPNILVGEVDRIDLGDGRPLDTTVTVDPSADLADLTRVEVLTARGRPQTVAAVP